jgi:hypothetical protein|tara:strand:+ start:323 stop:712 length:390 start_codon:yes stop_codon:yes gene_type:complete
MGQRINIQYSVDIDDLDTEVRRLMGEALDCLASLRDSDIYDNGRNTMLSNEALERVDRIRLELAAMDHRFNDVVNIISGYLHYKAQESIAREAPEQNSNPLRGNELEGKLEDFKSLMDASENEVSNQGK